MAATQSIDASDHPVKSVTVFKSQKAEVVRSFALCLEGGENRIEICNLSSSIDVQSARVSGLGGAARLFDVVCTLEKPKGLYANETIRQLHLKKKNLEAEKVIHDEEASLLIDYGRTLKAEHVTPDQMALFLQTFSDARHKHLTAVNELDERIHTLKKTIDTETDKASGSQGQAYGKVTAVLIAEKACSVTLRLTYIVADVSWVPVYDLRASTDDGQPSSAVTLHYRARITQSTREDWKDAALTLSTAVTHSTLGNTVPVLRTYKIRQVPFGAPAQQGLFGKPTAQVQFNTVAAQPATQAQCNNMFGQPAQQGGTGAFGQASQQGITSSFGAFGSVQQQQQAPSFGGLFGGVQPSQHAPSGAFGVSSQGIPAGSAFARAVAPASHPAPAHNEPPQEAHETQGPDDFAFVDAGENHSEVPNEAEESPMSLVQPVAEGTSIVRASPLSSSYLVEGKVHVPSDGVAHTVSIATLTFESEVTRVSVPRLRASVYLQCRVRNTSDYRLLPGAVNVFLDDSFTSQTAIPDIAVNDSFDCPLGVDPSVRISYRRTFSSAKDPPRHFGETRSTTTYTTRITVQNKHTFAIPSLVLRDALPVAEDNKVFDIILRKPKELSDSDAPEGKQVSVKVGKDGDKTQKIRWSKVVDGRGGAKEGKYEWLVEMKAGEEIVLEAECEVKAPTFSAWHEYVE